VILSDLRRYLQEREEATLSDMARRFQADPEVVRAMLEVWIAKGRIERCAPSTACAGNCNQCGPGAAEVYRWTGGGRGKPDAEARDGSEDGPKAGG
jgi:hypothetical protein